MHLHFGEAFSVDHLAHLGVAGLGVAGEAIVVTAAAPSIPTNNDLVIDLASVAVGAVISVVGGSYVKSFGIGWAAAAAGRVLRATVLSAIG